MLIQESTFEVDSNFVRGVKAMSDSGRKQAEKQAKIYLAVLASLLIVAVMVTVFTLYREEVPSAEGENSETPQQNGISAEAQRETPHQDAQSMQPEAKPVEQDFTDANSKIETETPKENSQQAAPPLEEEEPEDAVIEPEDDWQQGEAVEEFAAEPQNMTATFDPAVDMMVWPVSGAVLMDYSRDSLIYDRTLDLYRTNETLCIGAEEAEEVLAAADGIVTEIGASDALGNFVVLDNGDGCETTYGQLSEDVWVALGEYVAQGEALGCVDLPSWYSSALGTHLSFTVTVNGETVNPLEFLENVLEDE